MINDCYAVYVVILFLDGIKILTTSMEFHIQYIAEFHLIFVFSEWVRCSYYSYCFWKGSLLNILSDIQYIQLDFHFPVPYLFIELNMESLSVTLLDGIFFVHVFLQQQGYFQYTWCF